MHGVRTARRKVGTGGTGTVHHTDVDALASIVGRPEVASSPSASIPVTADASGQNADLGIVVAYTAFHALRLGTGVVRVRYDVPGRGTVGRRHRGSVETCSAATSPLSIGLIPRSMARAQAHCPTCRLCWEEPTATSKDGQMATTNPTGKAILKASLDLFRQDSQMIWLPVMAAGTALIAFALVTGPLVLVLGHNGFAIMIAFMGGSVVATAATVIFNVALCFAAADRIEGRTPTVAGALAQAWTRKSVIFQWAVLSDVVGTAIRALEQRLGLVGRLIGIAGGLAWAVATFMVIPVLAFENVGPIEAVKRSSSILKSRFGTVARGGLRFGLLFVGLSIAALVVVATGIVACAAHLWVIGVPVAVLGFAGLLGIAMYASAAGMYMRTILYRFATDQPIPDLDVDIKGAFRTS